MFVGMEQKTVLNELQRERNNDIITSFASDYSLRFVILQKITEKEVRLELEWTPDMLTTCNILFIKRNNFNIYKDITTFKIAEMLQIVNLDFQNESDVLSMSYQYINKLLMPMMSLYKNEVEKKTSTSEKNTANAIMRKMNELNFSIAQCQKTVTVQEVKLEIYPKIKEILAKQEKDKYLSNPELISAEDIAIMSEDVAKWNRDI